MRLIKFFICFVLAFISIQYGWSQNSSNKEIAIFYFEEVVNKQKLELLDQVFADTFLVHGLIDNTENHNTITKQKNFLKYLFNAFPDIHYTIGDIIEEEDKLAIRISFNATHKNEFLGYQPIGKRIDYLSEIFFFKFKNGKIVESWVQLDMHNLAKQLKEEK